MACWICCCFLCLLTGFPILVVRLISLNGTAIQRFLMEICFVISLIWFRGLWKIHAGSSGCSLNAVLDSSIQHSLDNATIQFLLPLHDLFFLYSNIGTNFLSSSVHISSCYSNSGSYTWFCILLMHYFTNQFFDDCLQLLISPHPCRVYWGTSVKLNEAH